MIGHVLAPQAAGPRRVKPGQREIGLPFKVSGSPPVWSRTITCFVFEPREPDQGQGQDVGDIADRRHS